MKLPPGHVPGAGVKKATAYGGLGEKLLKQYGWKEGQGLGVQGTGIKTAIKVLKKDDTIGVSEAMMSLLCPVGRSINYLVAGLLKEAARDRMHFFNCIK